MEKHLKRTAFFLMLLCTLGCVCFATPLIAVGTAEITGQTAKVPIELSGNTGICGAILSVRYDSELQLVEVKKGEALASMAFTVSGDTSANPINLGWDGLDEDATNGNIAYLTFALPNHDGDYEVGVFYREGDIFNSSLESITVQTQNGIISISSEKPDPVLPVDPTLPIGSEKTALFVEDIQAHPGEAIKVPIQLSGNKGICGAAIHITYDTALTLTGINKGPALSKLEMTTSGDLSTHPINIGWDGLEPDTSNGTIAWLCFTAPTSVGTYSIEISCNDGEVFDGNIESIDVQTVSAKVIVQKEDITNVTVIIGNRSSLLQGNPVGNSQIYVAYYSAAGKMLSVKIYPISDGGIYESADSTAKTAKIFWLDESLRPVCKAKTIYLK